MISQAKKELYADLRGLLLREDKKEWLCEACGNEYESEYPEWPQRMWRAAVADGATIDGYWDWVLEQMDEDGLFDEEDA